MPSFDLNSGDLGTGSLPSSTQGMGGGGFDYASLASGLGSLAGGIFGYFGQQSANDTNIMLANNATQFNAQQAQMNRDFQERMANTSWQRGVADMRAAGINPILAASKGGASSPGGGQASASTPSVENSGQFLGQALSGSIGSAMQVAKDVKSLEATDSQIAAQKAQAIATMAQAGNAKASAAATAASMPSILANARSAGSKADSEIAEAAARKAGAEWNKSMAGYDAVSKRVLEAIGGVSDAVSIGRLIQGSVQSREELGLRKKDSDLRSRDADLREGDYNMRKERHSLQMMRGIPNRLP